MKDGKIYGCPRTDESPLGKAIDDQVLCDLVVSAALVWHDVISRPSATHADIIGAEYNLARATERLHEHRS